MDSAERILVVFLSGFLALFLMLGIVLLVKLIQFTKKMHEIADRAHEIVDKASDIAYKVESVSDIFKKTAGPLALGKFFVNLADTVSKHKKEKR
jgi:DNA anti-recombination protein RmuC